jgi:TldD protein
VDYERLLSRYAYAELRIERSMESFVSIKDDEVKHTSGSVHGVSVRVLEEGSWGFAASSREARIEDLLEKARKMARLGKGKIAIDIPPAVKKEIKEKTDPVDDDQQVKSLAEAAREMKAQKVTSRTIACTDSVVREEFHNSHGTEIIQESGYTYLSCSCIARSGELMQRGSERAWSRSGFGKIDSLETAGKSREKALRLLDAAPPPKGRFTVIFDPEMSGVFSHEAVGHACEADSVIDRESVLAGKLGQAIGNELVTIIDDPAADGFGRYAYDDEGVPAKPAVLMENGVLKGYMNSMESAKELGIAQNGHARAGGYSEVPIVRMSNTNFQKGKSKVGEVFDIKEGIYLKGMKGGSVDIFSGGFMFKAEEAYDIMNGEKGKIMRDVTITGNILQTLLDVECVGNDFGISPGMCGKFSQEVPVSDGGPHIRLKNVAIG